MEIWVISISQGEAIKNTCSVFWWEVCEYFCLLPLPFLSYWLLQYLIYDMQGKKKSQETYCHVIFQGPGSSQSATFCLPFKVFYICFFYIIFRVSTLVGEIERIMSIPFWSVTRSLEYLSFIKFLFWDDFKYSVKLQR